MDDPMILGEHRTPAHGLMPGPDDRNIGRVADDGVLNEPADQAQAGPQGGPDAGAGDGPD